MYTLPIILFLVSSAFLVCDSRVLRLNQMSRPTPGKMVSPAKLTERTLPPITLAKPGQNIKNSKSGLEETIRRTRSNPKSKESSGKSTKSSVRSSLNKLTNKTQRIRKKRERERDSKDVIGKMLDMQVIIGFDDKAEDESYIGKIELRQFDMNLAFNELFKRQAVMSMDPETVFPSTTPASQPKSPSPIRDPVLPETISPTHFPVYIPNPTSMPSFPETSAPTIPPSSKPTKNLTNSPSTPPSASPSTDPVVAESKSPSTLPTELPVVAISNSPSMSPTLPFHPTASPIPLETLNPTLSPFAAPTLIPTTVPTEVKVCNPPITASERQKRILDQLDSVSNQTSILTPGTSQNDAFNWLLNTDPAQVCPENEVDVIQRYVMAVTYYSLGGDNWEKCSASTSSLCEGSVRYLSGNGVCEWYNVTCLGDSIAGIVLVDNNLQGTIPPETAALPLLQELILNINGVGGPFPEDLCESTSLKTLELMSNQIEGSLPRCVGNFEQLEMLSLEMNQMSGTLPTELGLLSSIEFLILKQNSFTGTIPTELGNNSALRALSIQQNSIEGSIPTELVQITTLETVDFFSNKLSGTVPSQMGNLLNTENMFFHFNSLTGSMPTEVCSLLVNGSLKQLTADCGRRGLVECSCCTACF